MLESIANYINEDYAEEEELTEDLNNTFNRSKEDLKKSQLEAFKANQEFEYREIGDYFSSEEEFLEQLDWDEIFEAIHEYCDEQTIREKLARCLEKNIEEIDFKKTVKIKEED